LYARVSSDPSGYGVSVSKQDAENREVCARMGWTIVASFCDNDASASRYATKGRPEFEQMRAALGPGRVLVARESSRFQRDLAVYVQLRDLCADRGAKLCYGGRIYDLTRGDDRFATGLDALLAEREADIIQERNLKGAQATLRAGRQHGRVPYGYSLVFNNATGLHDRVLDEKRAPILQDAARRVLAGESLRSIEADLIARGVWKARGQLRKRLLNPTYAGFRTSRGEIVKQGKWPPIFTPEEFQELSALLRSDQHTVSHRGTEPKHLLTGIAVCGVCGEAVIRGKNGSTASAKRRFEPYEIYCCPKRHVGRLIQRVNTFVEEFIIFELSQPGALEKLEQTEEVEEDPGGETAAELEKRLDGFAAEAAAGRISPQMIGKIEADLRAQIAEAELREAGRKRVVSPVLRGVAGPNAREEWEALTVPEKREGIRNFAVVTINPVRSRWGGVGVTVRPIRAGRIDRAV